MIRTKRFYWRWVDRDRHGSPDWASESLTIQCRMNLLWQHDDDDVPPADPNGLGNPPKKTIWQRSVERKMFWPEMFHLSWFFSKTRSRNHPARMFSTTHEKKKSSSFRDFKCGPPLPSCPCLADGSWMLKWWDFNSELKKNMTFQWN